jgi:hypothetical protein
VPWCLNRRATVRGRRVACRRRLGYRQLEVWAVSYNGAVLSGERHGGRGTAKGGQAQWVSSRARLLGGDDFCGAWPLQGMGG